MKKLISDIKTGIDAFKKARRSQSKTTIPVLSYGASFYDTVEGCTLAWCDKEIVRAAREAFNALDCEEQHRLAFVPKNGEFIARANFWRELLEPVLSPQQLRRAMMRIISWYIHIKQLDQTERR